MIKYTSIDDVYLHDDLVSDPAIKQGLIERAISGSDGYQVMPDDNGIMGAYAVSPEGKHIPLGKVDDVLLADAGNGVATDAPSGVRVGRAGITPAQSAKAGGLDRPLVALLDTLAGALQGATAQTIGLPGDIRSILDLISKDGAQKYLGDAVMPTTDRMQEILPSVIPDGVTNQKDREQTAKVFSDVGTFLPAPGLPEAIKPAAKLIKGAVKMTEGLPVGLSIKDVSKAVDTPQFKNWFGDWKDAPDSASKVVDETGAPLAVYHGTGRPDRIDANFRKSRATSGPMSFFTDNPEIASGYAKGKTDTSLVYDDNAYDYINWFKKKDGRSTLNLEQAGLRMSQDERKAVIDKLKDITQDEDTGEIVYKKGGGSIVSQDTFDFYLNRESGGNPLVAANKLWLESGNLYGKEEEFAKVLNLAGVKGFNFTSPHEKNPAIYKVYLNIKNPLDTDNISPEVMASLESAASRVRKTTQRGGADNWDKNTVSPQDWIERLKSDQKDGTTHAWTSIPDWVTKNLKEAGYDGIKDTGGKSGGVNHSVWIPFDETQVKSATGNKGTFDPNKKNILHGVGVGGAGAATQQNQENK